MSDGGLDRAAITAEYDRSCVAGDFEACRNLGAIYQGGLGVVKDARRATALFAQACNGGNVASCNHLAVALAQRDVSMAMHLLAIIAAFVFPNGTPIELSTTADRVIARLRIARQEQLGGHTPRPRAPADSLASAQVHESALTNAAASLGLDGQRLTAQELQTLMREKLTRSSEPTVSPLDADTVFDFAAQDAVRFRVADQRLELTLSLREVNHERNSVRNFRVHAFYVPVINGLEAQFVRDGALGIEGRIGTGERARMHGVFNKVLSEERGLPIVRLNDPNDKRLAGLTITQLVLEDGWIGLAIGPGYADRTAERTRMLR